MTEELEGHASNLHMQNAKVGEIENTVKLMKHYIANDYTGDDSATEESAAFSRNVGDLMDGVSMLIRQGGWKSHEIADALKYSLDAAEKDFENLKDLAVEVGKIAMKNHEEKKKGKEI